MFQAKKNKAFLDAIDSMLNGILPMSLFEHLGKVFLHHLGSTFA
jgi:hypothetical protein